MDTITSSEAIAAETTTPNRRRKTAKFALAGVAVVGIGAALTSAAWTDNVFFGGDAASADFELSGYDPTTDTWVPADGPGGARIQLPADAFANVGPNVADVYTVQVRNDGGIPIYLNDPQEDSTAGTLFEGNKPAIVSFGPYSDSVLDPGEIGSVDVIVTGGDWNQNQYRDATGSLIVQIQGTSEAPAAP